MPALAGRRQSACYYAVATFVGARTVAPRQAMDTAVRTANVNPRARSDTALIAVIRALADARHVNPNGNPDAFVAALASFATNVSVGNKEPTWVDIRGADRDLFRAGWV